MELEHIYERVKNELDAEDEAREKALILSRDCIQYCANSIRAVHRGDLEASRELLEKARGSMRRAQELLGPFPRIYFSGFLQDAEKEYTEASSTLALIQGDPLPLPQELGVGVAPYLNGLGEAVGEMRRHMLDLIRQNRLERGEEVLGLMDDIYYLLASVDYPSALTGGLKRTNDMVRGVLERTRGDLTTAIRRDSLERTLRELEDRLADEDRG